MHDLFIGPLRHWLVFAAVLAALWLMGAHQFHISNFKLYLLALTAISVGALGFIVLTYRRGERITRESLEDED